MVTTQSETPIWPNGAAYVDGRFMPIEEAAIPMLDWGYRRSDVTYDVVGVWQGAFFRLEDHLRRFRRSMQAFRLAPAETDDEIREILMECVRRSGLREAYVAMDCLRGRPRPGEPRHPAYCRNYIAAFAIPWVWNLPRETFEKGAHLVIARTQRIGEAALDPTAKNFHWGDLTQGLFEAHDQGCDTAVLLDAEGYVTEAPGFNVFAVSEGVVATPDRGALEGITRRSVIELCSELGLACHVRPMTAGELRDADEIFLSTTAGGIFPASRIDGRILNNDRPGPISERLRQAFWDRRAEGWYATPVAY
jgi:branched-chain amino acid aminotransferase